MNEPVSMTVFIQHFSPLENTIACFHFAFGSFSTIPYGRVHAVTLKTIPGAGWFLEIPRPLIYLVIIFVLFVV